MAELKSTSHGGSSRKKKRQSQNGTPSSKKRSKHSREIKETTKTTTTTTTTSPVQAKAVSKDGSKVKIEVKKVSPRENPIVVSFPCGVPSSLNTAVAARKDPKASRNSNRIQNQREELISTNNFPEFTWKKRGTSSSSSQTNSGMAIHGEDETCEYTASNDVSALDSRCSKMYVGVFDKEKGTLSFHPSAEMGTVYSLSQTVKAYEPTVSGDTMAGMTNYERKRFLVESFGSSKKKSAMKSQQANIVNVSNVIGSGDILINAMTKHNKISQSNQVAMNAARKGNQEDLVEKAYEEARLKLLPSFDKSATDPYNVYDVQELAGQEVWSQVSRIVDACVNTDSSQAAYESVTSRNTWATSCKTLLKSVIGNAKKSGMAKSQVKATVVLNYLIIFHNKCFRNMLPAEDVSKHVGIPRVICDKFVELFAIQSFDRDRPVYRIPKQLKDKRIIYILILYILAHGKAMKVSTINTLCQDIKLDTTDAARLLVQGGFKCSKDKRGNIGSSLSVPLTFPKPKRMKKTR